MSSRSMTQHFNGLCIHYSTKLSTHCIMKPGFQLQAEAQDIIVEWIIHSTTVDVWPALMVRPTATKSPWGGYSGSPVSLAHVGSQSTAQETRSHSPFAQTPYCHGVLAKSISRSDQCINYCDSVAMKTGIMALR